MNRLQWYAVRCCCQPEKVFGFLPLPMSPQDHYVVKDRWGTEHRRIWLRQFVEYKVENRHYDFASAVISEISRTDDPRRMELAVYSDDRSIEFWRTIPGFMEVRP